MTIIQESIAKQDLMLIHFPLLSTVFARDNWFFSSEIRVDWFKIHVPDTDQEIFEFSISLIKGAQDLMVLHKILNAYCSIIRESCRGIIMSFEQIQEFNFALLCGLCARQAFGMSLSLKHIFNF